MKPIATVFSLVFCVLFTHHTHAQTGAQPANAGRDIVVTPAAPSVTPSDTIGVAVPAGRDNIMTPASTANPATSASPGAQPAEEKKKPNR